MLKRIDYTAFFCSHVSFWYKRNKFLNLLNNLRSIKLSAWLNICSAYRRDNHSRQMYVGRLTFNSLLYVIYNRYKYRLYSFLKSSLLVLCLSTCFLLDMSVRITALCGVSDAHAKFFFNISCSKICMFPIKRLPLHSQKRKGWFGSSVGLEQQPSKLWVKGSNPFRITKRTSFEKSFFVIYLL